jgi:hypothetical protein
MKYAIVILESDEHAARQSEAEHDFDALVRWYAELRAQGKLVASARLAPARTATAISWRGQQPIVMDGPFVEAKESVGGFILFDVATEAEALDIACSLPARDGARIELRPVVETPPAVEA